MQTKFYRQHTSTLQFVLLALIYALPLFSNRFIQPVAQENLEAVLVFEFGVLTYGWFIISLFFIPIAMVDSVWLRRVCLILACLLAIPLSSSFTDLYGGWSRLWFIWLLFVNYCGVFLSKVKITERGKLATEIAMRCILYLLFFCTLIAVLDLHVSVNSWRGKDPLLFGFIYFSVSAFVEYKRYFQRGANIIFHLMSGRYVRPPKSRIRYKKGKIKAYILKKSSIHQWPLLLISGICCTGISSVFLYASLNMGSWVGITALWMFLFPFFLLGAAFLITAPIYAYLAFRAGAALLNIREDELNTDHYLIAEGFIPRYSKKEERENIDVELICYKVSPLEEDLIGVEKAISETMSPELHEYAMDHGTKFSVEYRMPALDKIEIPGTYYVWHLQFNIREMIKHKKKVVNVYTWTLAFPLPVH